MPDVWTTRRDHLKMFLEQLGADCEVEPRVLTPRDPTWTCHVNGPDWIGDVYMHEVSAVWTVPLVNELLLAMLILGLLAGMRLQRFLR